MLDVREPRLRALALEGNFGLEREALRVTGGGRMALTPHPFPPDHPRIVRDFCENQTEINTGVHPTAEEAGRLPLRAFRESPAPLTPRLQTFGLQRCEAGYRCRSPSPRE